MICRNVHQSRLNSWSPSNVKHDNSDDPRVLMENVVQYGLLFLSDRPTGLLPKRFFGVCVCITKLWCPQVCHHKISEENFQQIEILNGRLLDELWHWPDKIQLFVSETNETQLDSLNLDYDVSLSSLRKGTFTLGFEIRMKRKISRSAIEVISPAGFLVVASWVSMYQFI